MEFIGCFKYEDTYSEFGVFYKFEDEENYFVDSLSMNDFGIAREVGLTEFLPILVLVKGKRFKVPYKTKKEPIYVVDFSAFELGYLYFRQGIVICFHK